MADITDIVGLCGVEGEIADSRDQSVNAESYNGKEEICGGSRGIALGL